MAAIMIVICIVMVVAGHDSFVGRHDPGASTMQTPHVHTDVQR